MVYQPYNPYNPYAYNPYVNCIRFNLKNEKKFLFLISFFKNIQNNPLDNNPPIPQQLQQHQPPQQIQIPKTDGEMPMGAGAQNNPDAKSPNDPNENNNSEDQNQINQQLENKNIQNTIPQIPQIPNQQILMVILNYKFIL